LDTISNDVSKHQDLQMHCNTLNQKLMLKDQEIQKTLERIDGLNNTIISLEEGIETNQKFAEEKAI
jgi:hypothetical protein